MRCNTTHGSSTQHSHIPLRITHSADSAFISISNNAIKKIPQNKLCDSSKSVLSIKIDDPETARIGEIGGQTINSNSKEADLIDERYKISRKIVENDRKSCDISKLTSTSPIDNSLSHKGVDFPIHNQIDNDRHTQRTWKGIKGIVITDENNVNQIPVFNFPNPANAVTENININYDHCRSKSVHRSCSMERNEPKSHNLRNRRMSKSCSELQSIDPVDRSLHRKVSSSNSFNCHEGVKISQSMFENDVSDIRMPKKLIKYLSDSKQSVKKSHFFGVLTSKYFRDRMRSKTCDNRSRSSEDLFGHKESKSSIANEHSRKKSNTLPSNVHELDYQLKPTKSTKLWFGNFFKSDSKSYLVQTKLELADETQHKTVFSDTTEFHKKREKNYYKLNKFASKIFSHQKLTITDTSELRHQPRSEASRLSYNDNNESDLLPANKSSTEALSDEANCTTSQTRKTEELTVIAKNQRMFVKEEIIEDGNLILTKCTTLPSNSSYQVCKRRRSSSSSGISRRSSISKSKRKLYSRKFILSPKLMSTHCKETSRPTFRSTSSRVLNHHSRIRASKSSQFFHVLRFWNSGKLKVTPSRNKRSISTTRNESIVSSRFLIVQVIFLIFAEQKALVI